MYPLWGNLAEAWRSVSKKGPKVFQIMTSPAPSADVAQDLHLEREEISFPLSVGRRHLPLSAFSGHPLIICRLCGARLCLVFS